MVGGAGGLGALGALGAWVELLLLLVGAQAQVVFPPVDPGVKACSEGKVCIQSNECQRYQEKKQELNNLPKGSKVHSWMVTNLKHMICNRKERKVCCPINTSAATDASYGEAKKRRKL